MAYSATPPSASARWLPRALSSALGVITQGAFPARMPDRAVIVCNHVSFLDGLLLGAVVPTNAVFVVHTSIAQGALFKRALRHIEHLTIDTNSPLALKSLIRLIEAGRPVVIFPEGRLTVTGSQMKVYDGAAFLAAKTGATVFPVTLQGTEHTYFSRLGKLVKQRLRPQIRMVIGEPAQLTVEEGASARERRKQAGDSLRKLMSVSRVRAEPDRTLYQALLASVRANGGARALAEDIRFVQNSETGKDEPMFVEASARDFLKMVLGIRRISDSISAPGDFVGVMLPNSTGTAAAFFGLSAGGRIPAMLNYSTGADSVKAAIETAQVKTVLSSRAFIAKGKLESLVSAIEAMPDVKLYYAEDLKAQLSSKDKLWVAKHLLFPAAAEVRATPGCPAVVLFTSGSESVPKGVVHSHRSLLANVSQIRATADFSPADKFMSALPLFHSFGLTAGTLLPILAGARVFFYPNPLHFRVVPELTYDRNATVILGTSTFLAGYARFAHPYDFARVRYVVAGAEKLSAAVRELWSEKFGIRILEGYGATECAPVISVNTPFAFRRGGVGQPVPDLEVALEPVEGVATGGVLHVRGPNLMMGYMRHERPGVIEPPSSRLGLGWYETGDICSIDADGFITIEGRLKRFAKIAGEMVALSAVERVLEQTWPDGLHAVVALPDKSKGERLALVTTQPDITRAELSRAFKEQGLSALHVPTLAAVVPGLPMLGALKVDYLAVARLAAAATVSE